MTTFTSDNDITRHEFADLKKSYKLLKDKYFRLTKQSIYLNNPENNTITLGKEEHISLSAKTVQANNDILKAMEKITPASTILKKAKENSFAFNNY